MPRRIDPRYFNNFIDANVLNRLGDGHDDAVDEMLSLYERSEITLLLPSRARSCAADSAAGRRRGHPIVD